MKIGITGLGVIGSACKYGFEKLGHKVSFHDPKFDTRIEDILDTQIVYVCVPTPQNENGSCNTSIVKDVVEELVSLDYLKNDGLIAIKSTIEPNTTQKLIEKYSTIGICFVPEFLRERCSFSDFTEHHDLLAVGTMSQTVFDLVVKCHGKYPKNTVQLSPTEAELLKYYSNVFNATRVVFANEMYEICKAIGANYTNIKNAFIKRGTANDMYLDVNESFRGYSGVCLPKDTRALAHLSDKLGLDMKFFEMLDKENSKFTQTVFDGMRKR